MEILMEHWLSVGTGIFLLAMILYGHYRGFVHLAVSLAVLFLSVVVVRTAMPMVNHYLTNNTEIYQSVGKGLLKMAGGAVADEVLNKQSEQTDASLPAQQRKMIEQLKLPEQMKNVLLENNNSEIYHMLGVDVFADYVSTYLAGMILNLIGSVILFLLIYIGIRMILRWIDLIARIPILHGINQLIGAVLGGVHGLLLVWLFFLTIRICSGMLWTQTFLSQIKGSLWLSFLYENNIFNWGFVRILNMFL